MEPTIKSQSPDIMPVAWQQDKALTSCITELYDKGLWTDVKFHCKDQSENTRIHAHKVVLAARSPVFQAMFYGPCADGKDDIELDQAEANILDLFLRYLYSDTTDLNEETAPAVLEMAHFYQVTNLVQFSADYLATILTTGNACRFLTEALLYQVTSLRDACCFFIDENANEILNSEEFLEMSEECLRYILKGDTFYADEKSIFMKAEEWSARKLQQKGIEKTGQKVREVLGETFYHLRLPTMTSKTLMECTRRKGYFSSEEYEDLFDYVNRTPGSSVESNSCVARLPTNKTLTLYYDELNEMLNLNYDEESVTMDTVSTSFIISVHRDIKLINIVLTKLQQYLKFETNHYTESNTTGSCNYTEKTYYLLKNNPNTVVKIGSILDLSINKLGAIQGGDLPDILDVVISGSLTITNTVVANGDKSKKGNNENDEKNVTGHGQGTDGDENLEEEDTDDNSDDKNVNETDHDDDNTNVVFEQKFQLPSSELSHGTINLKEPVILMKGTSPYTVQLVMHNSCPSRVKMKVWKGENTDTIGMENDQVKVENIEGDFAGIQSLGFENISNRETAFN